jgi:hypothetical protein
VPAQRGPRLELEDGNHVELIDVSRVFIALFAREPAVVRFLGELVKPRLKFGIDG